MQKEEYNKITEEMKPFLINGKITIYTEIKWLEFRKIVKLHNNNINDMSIIMGTAYKTQYPEYQKKLNQFWSYKKYSQSLKTKEIKDKKENTTNGMSSEIKPVTSKNTQQIDPFISDALSKF